MSLKSILEIYISHESTFLSNAPRNFQKVPFLEGFHSSPLYPCGKSTCRWRRGGLFFLWAKMRKLLKLTYIIICAQYGDNVVSQRSVYKWREIFKKGWKSMTDAQPSGHSLRSSSDEKLEEPRGMVLGYRKVTVADIAQELNTSQESVHSAL